MDEFVKSRIKQVRKGDQNAFGEIVELYKDKVFQLCFRMLGNSHEAEDISQEAFMRAYINIERYNIDRKFSTWLYRIATNLCIDRIRKKKPDYYLDAEVAGTEGLTLYSQIPASQLAPDEEVSKIELQEIIQNEILKLPEKYRTVIVLRYIEELPLLEISKILDLPIGTIKTRIHRGREALRKQLRHI
ncbi:RNA polymerase sigma factor SigW [Caldibacillus thermoamylovorans]|uniref:RNA polymerase sigma factor SigW n=1 Tax=Caldibacillus thermoamylovorans TaxID=35841 RepID=UPI00203CF1AE|nr:RNA polymerase sigma factor SigW [Caldibacillus thermoamylovorans]MCM3800265.1 RNA polymerase sigma factor SigW [Caldibacillus thermoamylovorans]